MDLDVRGEPRAPTGTHDVLWPDSGHWEALIASFAQQVERAGYGLVLSPMFEYAEVFRRGIGADSDVVGKEMYEFADRDGKVLALRPEGTASVVRAFVEHRPTVPWKAWYVTPAFRHERPQAGRYRQHHQLGVEALGSGDADLDVEVVGIAADFIESIGLHDVELKINSMGDATCRPAYIERLRVELRERRELLCDDHRGRIEGNPLRILDCKTEQCRGATEGVPKLVDALCEPCAAHFSRFQSGLNEVGVSYAVDFRLVRGFDYYNRTTFEFASHAIAAAQNAIGGGGRYDGLVEMMGGPPTPGIGFGIGIERALLAVAAESAVAGHLASLDAFVVDVVGGDAARDLTVALRRAGFHADRAFDGRSMKSQMKAADRSGAEIALIVGPNEHASGTVTLRTLRREGPQRVIPRADVVTEMRRRRGEEVDVGNGSELLAQCAATEEGKSE
ncbi:MAG: histidine--tRNA ligase [Acidimicrobiales bacterium]